MRRRSVLVFRLLYEWKSSQKWTFVSPSLQSTTLVLSSWILAKNFLWVSVGIKDTTEKCANVFSTNVYEFRTKKNQILFNFVLNLRWAKKRSRPLFHYQILSILKGKLHFFRNCINRKIWTHFKIIVMVLWNWSVNEPNKKFLISFI